jgi:hypothetical protein
MLTKKLVRILGERYAQCLAEERDLERRPGQPLGPFKATRKECEEWVKTQGSDPDEPPPRVHAMVPVIYEIAKATWVLLDENFPRDRRGPTVFLALPT